MVTVGLDDSRKAMHLRPEQIGLVGALAAAWNCSTSIYRNRTLCPFDRLRVGMSNGRNAERL